MTAPKSSSTEGSFPPDFLGGASQAAGAPGRGDLGDAERGELGREHERLQRLQRGRRRDLGMENSNAHMSTAKYERKCIHLES